MSAPSVERDIAKLVAEHVVVEVAKHLVGRDKPVLAGDADYREVLLEDLGVMRVLTRSQIRHEVQPIADVICDEIDARGALHSFVAPTWQREGSSMLGEHTASISADGPVIRAVVFREADGRERLAVLWSARFAAEGSPVAPHAG